MIKSVDVYFDRRYDAVNYDCLHFTREVWKDLTGEDIGDRLSTLLGRGSARRVAASHRRAFRRLAAAEDPCLVLMRRRRAAPHVGVYLRGRVLHLTERGVCFHLPEVAAQAVFSLGYYQ